MMVSADNPTGNCSDNVLQEPRMLKTHYFPKDFSLIEARSAGSNYISSDTDNDILDEWRTGLVIQMHLHAPISQPNQSHHPNF